MNCVFLVVGVVTLLTFCRTQVYSDKGAVLWSSGYHLCTRNVTRQVTYLVEYTVPYTVTKPCGWIFWTTCRVKLYKRMQKTQNKTMTEQVTRCCDDFVQVGHYCAPTVNRSREVTAKPGNCPAEHGLSPGSELCEWDVDCLGWKKCCSSVCTDPTSMNFLADGRHRFNATVTVKTDYQQMILKDEGLFNHSRLLHSLVTGALQAAVSIYYLDSWTVHPFTTSTSLLIDLNSTLSLPNVTSKLHLLLKHIQEVSSVMVEDINECAHPPLRHCPPHADCSNTVGSFRCTCLPGFTDSDPSDTGVNCTVADSVTLTPVLPPINTTNAPDSNSTPDPEGNTTIRISSSTGTVNTSLSHTPWSSASTLTSTTCSPPSISSFRSSHVTGMSFCITWSSWPQGNHTYRVEVLKGSEVIYQNITGQTRVAVGGLKPGVLYVVTVTTMVCGGQGDTYHLSIKTDAQTLDATARLTDIEFSSDLQNSSSQAYKNLTQSITQEIYQSLSLQIKALVDSGQVRIEVTGFAPGSVIVIFNIIFSPSQSQDIGNVSEAVMDSLKNSSKYSVDENNTNINDFDECTSGQNDCSHWATCTNVWASYSCVCNQGYVDNDPQRPGRACREVTTSTLETTTQPMTTTASTVSPAPSSGSHVYPMLTESTIVTSQPTTTTTLTTSTAYTVPTAIASTATMATTMTTAVMPPTTIATHSTTTTTIPPVTSAMTLASTDAMTTTTSTSAALATTDGMTTTTSAALATTDRMTTATSAALATTDRMTTATSAALMTTDGTTTATSTSAALATTDGMTTATSTSAALMTTDGTTTTTVALTTQTTALTTTTTATMPPTTTSIASTPLSPVPTTTPGSPVPTTTTSMTTTAVAPDSTTTPTTTISITSANPDDSTVTTTASVTLTTTTTTTTTTTPTTVTPTPVTTSEPSPPTLGTIPRVSALQGISVTCSVAAITVTVERSFLQISQILDSALYLGLEECGVNWENSTHVQLTVVWDECDVILMHNDSYYSASVTLFSTRTSDPGPVEPVRLQVPIMCTYMKSLLISSDFGSMGYDMIQDLVVGSGLFQVSVLLMNGTAPLPQNYSLSRDEAVVVVVRLNTSADHVKVIINKCWATPTPSPSLLYSHTFLENRCSLNTFTEVLTNGNSSTSSVSVKIFSFVDLNLIYLHCQVEICVDTGSSSCVPDCFQRATRSGKTIAKAFGSSGPLLRLDDEALEEGLDTLHIAGMSCLGVGLLLLFIVGFVCLFFYQRNRIGHYNFNIKPKEENFTYLHFNT